MQASCQCGALTARVPDDAEPMVVMCHCLDCRKRSGSPFGSIAYFSKEQVAISGEAKEYARPTDSGSTFTTGFCPACGSTVYALPARIPAIVGITIGSFAQHALTPAVSVYEQSRAEWVAVPEGAARHPRGRDS